MIVEIFGRTERGRANLVNEDHLLLGCIVQNNGRSGLWFDSPGDDLGGNALLLAVADGIGGEKGGTIASRTTLESLARHWATRDVLNNCEDSLSAAALYANDMVLSKANSVDSGLVHMGSTLAGICLLPEGALVFSAGDSRVYLVREGGVTQLTRNDNFSEQAIMLGVDPAVARADREASSLTNWVGKRGFRLNSCPRIPLSDGDVFVICSDGLFSTVSENRIGEVTAESSKSLRDIGDLLVDDALSAEACDDTSLVLLRIVGSEQNVKQAGGVP